MNGWLSLLLFALAAGVLLWLLKLPRRHWSLVAAAAAIGAAGYAWQGHPGYDGHPVVGDPAAVQAGELDLEFTPLREALFGRFNEDDAQFKTADALTRAGSPDYAATVMLLAVRKYPQDAALWTGLGLKTAEKDGNIVSPAARFAFDRAMALAPQHPGPPFFLGVAALRAGDVRTTIAAWQKAIELTPKEASYRNQMVSALVRLIQFLEARKKAAEQAGTPSMSFEQAVPR